MLEFLIHGGGDVEVPLLAELQRRRVFRALVAYAIAAFAILQIIEPVMHGLHWPDAVLSYTVVALALGFPVVVTLAWIFDVEGGPHRTKRPAQGTLRGMRVAALLVGIGVLAALPGVLYYFVVRRPPPEAAAPAQAIAVLPFVNMSSDKENDYFSDGITEELINALANVDGLRVVSRTAVFALKGKDLGVDEIGVRLKASTLLEGSVRREGNALRVTAQLINVSDGYHLWSKTYDREAKSIFALEDEIARSIAQALRRTLVRSEATKPQTSDLEAHDLYLKGRYFWNKRTLEAFRVAEEYFQKAIRKDPSYALAHAGLADAIALRMDYDQVRTSEIAPQARTAAQRAVELDPTLAEAHCSLGNIALHEFDWATAEREMRVAADLKPGYATVHQWLAEMLIMLGRFNEARDEIDRALRADPTSLIVNSIAGRVELYNGNLEGAVERYRRTLDMDSSFDQARGELVTLYLWHKKTAEATAELDRIHSWPQSAMLSNRALVHAIAGRRSEALAAIRKLEEESRHTYVQPSSFGYVWVALGEPDRAFPFLEKGCAELDDGLLGAKVDPLLQPIRPDPRFKRLLKCLHLDE